MTMVPPASLLARLAPLMRNGSPSVVSVGASFDLLDVTWDVIVNVAGGIAVGVVAGLLLVEVFKRVVGMTPSAFRRVHRSGIIACHYRAAEWRHKEIELAAHDLLQLLDKMAA